MQQHLRQYKSMYAQNNRFICNVNGYIIQVHFVMDINREIKSEPEPLQFNIKGIEAVKNSQGIDT